MSTTSFRYLPAPPEAEPWGLIVTGAGSFQTQAKSVYPPERHPNDHMYEWSRGRVLSCYQIFCIHQGNGELQSKIHPPQRLGPDMAFLLRPGVWHRFRPDPATGWSESWIEFQGLVPDALSQAGQMGESMIARPHASSTGLPEAINVVFQRICHALPGLDPQMTALAMEAVAAWSLLWTPRAKDDEADQALSIATHFLEREYRTSIDLEALARRVGMSYSSFRRTFQKRTGFAPWKYVQHLRLVNARNRLSSTSDTLEEIAIDLGFSSGFHLSTAFRNEFGVSPSKWKKQK